jgi:hypothetical protein
MAYSSPVPSWPPLRGGLYFFGFKESGIAIAYVLGYVLAAFTTFVTILGRCGTLQKLF